LLNNQTKSTYIFDGFWNITNTNQKNNFHALLISQNGPKTWQTDFLMIPATTETDKPKFRFGFGLNPRFRFRRETSVSFLVLKLTHPYL